MQLMSIRVPAETVERLKTLARQEAARRNEDVSWSSLVREALDERLRQQATATSQAGRA